MEISKLNFANFSKFEIFGNFECEDLKKDFWTKMNHWKSEYSAVQHIS